MRSSLEASAEVAAAFEPRLECAGRAVDVVVFDPTDAVGSGVLPQAGLSGPLRRGRFSRSRLVEFAAGLRTPARGPRLEVPALTGGFILVALGGRTGRLGAAELFAGCDQRRDVDRERLGVAGGQRAGEL